MRAFSPILAAVLLTTATAAWAQAAQTKPVKHPGAAPAARVKTAADKADSDAVVVCIHHQQLGSRIPGKKECHTLRVWNQMTDDARRTVEDLQRMTMQHMQ